MGNPKILLTISPLFWPKMPPLGLGFLQAYLAAKEIEVDILDSNNLFFCLADAQLKKEWLVSCNQPLEERIFYLIKNNFTKKFNQYLNRMADYDVVGFSCFKSNLRATLEIAKELRNKKNKIKIVFGGPEITRQLFKGRGKIDPGISRLADFLVAGEGEKPFNDYLCGKNIENKIVAFQQLEDLADLDFPKFSGLDIDLYPKKYTLPLLFTRGCIRKCDFCSERLLTRGFRARKVNSVIEEIRYHKEKNKVNSFVFFDSLINGDLIKLEDLCDKIILNFGSINWEAQIAVRGDMRQGIFDKIKKSGCYNLFVGLESGSDNVLKKMNKGFTTADALEFLRKLNKAKLFFGISLITGYPQETRADFQKGLDFIIANKGMIPKIEQVNPFTYYDGTKADRKGDYKINNEALRRLEILVQEIKHRGFKYTNAFLGNLMEKNG
ncbi:MAG: B12-binding domain-containing radical SAM protein [Candidatus Omnitrophota bacterium]